jgi:hypothetical protein
MLLAEDSWMICSSSTDSSQAEWDLGGKTLAWKDRQGQVRITTLPTLAEIDAAERVNSTRPDR